VQTFNGVLECGDLSPLSHFFAMGVGSGKTHRRKYQSGDKSPHSKSLPLGGEGLAAVWRLCNMLREDIVVSANDNVYRAGAASVLGMLKPMLVTP